MERSLNKLLHRKNRSSVDGKRNVSQTSASSEPSSSYDSPYKRTLPGKPPEQGSSPVHGNSPLHTAGRSFHDDGQGMTAPASGRYRPTTASTDRSLVLPPQDTSLTNELQHLTSASPIPAGASPHTSPNEGFLSRKPGGHSTSSSWPLPPAGSAPNADGYLVKDALEAPSLEGVVDLRNTEDTTLQTKWAPAVTHETIYPETHHIRKEEIHREIHTHDVHHRILPVIDVQVLPARHFLTAEGGGLVEIDEDEVPGRVGKKQHWIIAETASQLASDETPPKGPRRFTAREFPGEEGDEKSYVAPEGHIRTESTWVHPPTVEEGGRLTGQTYPFHFGTEGEKVALKPKGPRDMEPHSRRVQ